MFSLVFSLVFLLCTSLGDMPVVSLLIPWEESVSCCIRASKARVIICEDFFHLLFEVAMTRNKIKTIAGATILHSQMWYVRYNLLWVILKIFLSLTQKEKRPCEGLRNFDGSNKTCWKIYLPSFPKPCDFPIPTPWTSNMGLGHLVGLHWWERSMNRTRFLYIKNYL